MTMPRRAPHNQRSPWDLTDHGRFRRRLLREPAASPAARGAPRYPGDMSSGARCRHPSMGCLSRKIPYDQQDTRGALHHRGAERCSVRVRCERDYRALRVRGQLPPDLVGILLSIAEPLAQAGLSIFAISTYDTDYVLIKERDLAAALKALRAAGHQLS